MSSNICPRVDGVGTGSFKILGWSAEAKPGAPSTKTVQRGKQAGGQKFVDERQAH
jgi:hypothetical protein